MRGVVGQDEREFAELAGPLRAEILGHCYRMLGSGADAEDAVQETFVRGWRAYGKFEGRSSFRSWLYRIATNACLRLMEQRGRRALPSGLGTPEADWHEQRVVTGADVRWVQPLAVDPAEVVGLRQHVRLAFVAALQHLPARQRAVLILRDVAGLSAEEVAGALDTTTVAVNSALRRARAQLERVAPAAEEIGEPDDPGRMALLDRYVTAFQVSDLGLLTAVLREDVTLEMPPHVTWFAGRAEVTGFLGARVLGRPGQFRVVPLAAALAFYVAGPGGGYDAHGVHVLEVGAGGVSGIYAFLQPGLVAEFGLPLRLEAGEFGAVPRIRTV